MTTLTETVVPTWIAVALGVATLAMLLGIVLLTLRSKKATAAQQDPSVKNQKALRRLFIAALIPTLTVIAAVMGISFIGLSSFARHDMGWHSWVSLIVPISLDGISITFGFWAFVAVKRGRHPGRSEKIVYVGALISAWINYNHGRQEWTGAAGIYLGFLSLAAAWMFHELLSQFMDAQHTLPKARRNGTPMFGERWMWAPWSTLMARRAWVVYPPTPDTEPTAANALAHLEQTRVHRTKKRQRQTAATKPAATKPATTKPVDTPTPKPSTPRKATTKATTGKPPATTTRPRKPTTTTAPATGATPTLPDPTRAVSVPEVPAITSPAPVSVPPSPAPTAAASATDTTVATADAARLKAPVPASLLTRARYLADAHQETEGTPIPAGKLAAQMRVNSDVARQLLAVLDLDTSRVTDPATPVNGNPVSVSR